MSPELRDLLATAGVEFARDADSWRRVIVLRNFGLLPQSSARDQAQAAQGFKLLLLDANYRPRYFCRCGAASDQLVLQESQLLDWIASDAVGRRTTPHLRSVTGKTLHVQLSRYAGNTSFSDLFVKQRPNDFVRSVGEILSVSRTLLRRIENANQLLFPSVTRETRERHLRVDLETLAQAGLRGVLRTVIERELEPVLALPMRLQHGDFWTDNILWHEKSWWLIDFAECGAVWVPLFDAIHLINTAGHSNDGLIWLEQAQVAKNPWSKARLGALRAAARSEDVPLTHLGAVIIYYLVHLAAYRMRPGISPEFSDFLVNDLMRIARRLADGGTAQEIVTL